MFSALIGQLIEARCCRKDSTGRLVFLPYGRRRTGYYVDSPSDYQKVKALVAIYSVASLLFQVLGSTTSIVMAIAASSDYHGSLAGKLQHALIIYIISAFAVQWLPMLLLWRLYRALLPELCSSLQELSLESTRNLQSIPNPIRRFGVIVAIIALVVMGVVLVLVSRPQCMTSHPAAVFTQR